MAEMKKMPPVGARCFDCGNILPRMKLAWIKPKKGPTRFICPVCEEKIVGKGGKHDGH